MPENIEISFSKRKVIPFVLGSMFFVLAGIFVLSIALKVKSQVFLQLFFITIGFLCILFFGLIAILMVSKLFTSKPGLIISEEGLSDFSTGVSAGFVAWGEIKKINYSYSGKNTFLVVIVKKPDKFIKRQTNLLKKLAMQMNYKISGSPIHILVSVLDIDLIILNDHISSKRYSKAKVVDLE
jgi:hypothetical protein